MQLQEGQVYEGTISISGDDGPFRRWIVVAPFGKTHIHCIDEPLRLRCWPAALVEAGVQSGRLRLVDTVSDHPIIAVQRLKETLKVPDTHLAISARNLQRLLDALRDAVRAKLDYAPYLAGEILAAVERTAVLAHRQDDVATKVHAILDGEDDALHTEVRVDPVRGDQSSYLGTR